MAARSSVGRSNRGSCSARMASPRSRCPPSAQNRRCAARCGNAARSRRCRRYARTCAVAARVGSPVRSAGSRPATRSRSGWSVQDCGSPSVSPSSLTAACHSPQPASSSARRAEAQPGQPPAGPGPFSGPSLVPVPGGGLVTEMIGDPAVQLRDGRCVRTVRADAVRQVVQQGSGLVQPDPGGAEQRLHRVPLVAQQQPGLRLGEQVGPVVGGGPAAPDRLDQTPPLPVQQVRLHQREPRVHPGPDVAGRVGALGEPLQWPPPGRAVGQVPGLGERGRQAGTRPRARRSPAPVAACRCGCG